MNRLSVFIMGIAATFGLPWLVLVVGPYASMHRLDPIPYGEADEGAENTMFPPGRAGLVSQGHRVYAREGCVYCHTQVIRPTYAGGDRWRPGWAGRGPNYVGVEPPAPLRETRPQDYAGESYAFLGIQRNGPDLSNVGWRRDEPWHHRHLYDPRSLSFWSKMPSYKNLYQVRRITGQPSDEALELEGDAAPPEGYEVVPTSAARALVSYLMSLKKDHMVPVAGGESEATAAPAATAAAPAAAPSS